MNSLALISLVTTLVAAAPPTDVSVQVQNHMKIVVDVLSWERNLKVRCPNGLRLGVVIPAGMKTPSLTRSLVENLDHGRFQAQGMVLEPAAIEASPGRIEEAIRKESACVLYLVPGVDSALPEITAAARETKALVLSGSPAHLGSASVAIAPTDSGPPITVDLHAAGMQGASFDARFLRLTNVRDADKPMLERPDDARKRRLSGKDPEYPRAAQAAKVEGTVTVKVTIGPGGQIVDLTFIEAHEAFVQSVRDALATWRFAPKFVDDRPASTVTIFKFGFHPKR